jgi:hypothetical protein
MTGSIVLTPLHFCSISQLGSLLGADFATLSRDPFLNSGQNGECIGEAKRQMAKPNTATILCEDPPIDWSLKRLIRVCGSTPLTCCQPQQSSTGKWCHIYICRAARANVQSSP